jgi:hypothetical protein
MFLKRSIVMFVVMSVGKYITRYTWTTRGVELSFGKFRRYIFIIFFGCCLTFSFSTSQVRLSKTSKVTQIDKKALKLIFRHKVENRQNDKIDG